MEVHLQIFLFHDSHRPMLHHSNVYWPQVWDWLFKSCEVNGRILLQDGLITTENIEECILKGSCKQLSIKLPAWCILRCLLSSAKSNSHGLVICKSLLQTLGLIVWLYRLATLVHAWTSSWWYGVDKNKLAKGQNVWMVSWAIVDHEGANREITVGRKWRNLLENIDHERQKWKTWGLGRIRLSFQRHRQESTAAGHI